MLITRTTLRSAITARLARVRNRAISQPERGDLPGWVLITVMTAALVTLIWAFAGDTLITMFQDAINSVRP